MRHASAAFWLVLAVSAYVLFAPSQVGPTLFEGSDKLVHATLFAALAWTALRQFGTVALVPVALYAPGSELVQWLALPHRSGDPLDVVADLVGVGAVALLRPAAARAGRGRTLPGRG